MTRPPCRCLLREAGVSHAETVYRYIESLPAEEKTGPEEYRKRLGVCAACRYLRDGLCTACGCFAEARAAKKRMHCPMGEERW